MGGFLSPDGDFLAAPSLQEIKIWDVHKGRKIPHDIKAALGSGTAWFSEKSFWVHGRDHDLCVGLGWATQGRQGNLVVKYPDTEVVVVDVARGTVSRRIKGAFVAPAADGNHVVVWQDGKLVFVPL